MNGTALRELLGEVLRETSRENATAVEASGRAFEERLPAMLQARDVASHIELTGAARDAIVARLLASVSESHTVAPSIGQSLADWLSQRTWFSRWRWGLALGTGAVAVLVAILLWFATQRDDDRQLAETPKRNNPPERQLPKPEVPNRPAPRNEGPVVLKVPNRPPQPNRVIPPKRQGPLQQDSPRIVEKHDPAGKFGTVVGQPLVFLAGGNEPIVAKNGEVVAVGARVETGDADRVEILLADGSTLRLGFNSIVAIVRDNGGASEPVSARNFELTKGTVFAKVVHTSDDKKFTVKTPVATAEVWGTEFMLGLEFAKSANAERTLRAVLQVKDGSVAFYNHFKRVIATAMTESTADSGTAPTEPKRVRTLREYRFTLGPQEWNIVVGAEKLSEELAESRYVYPRGSAGFAVARMAGGLVRIVEIASGSPASKLGLKVGDVVLAVNGVPDVTAESVRRTMAQSVGREVEIEIDRQGERLKLTLTTGRDGPTMPSVSQEIAQRLFTATWRAMSGDRVEALRLLRGLAADAPGGAVFNNLGVVHELEDNLGDAIRNYQAAVRIEPKVALYRHNLGLALQQIGNLSRAVEELEAAVELNPSFDGAVSDLSRAYTIVGRFDDALSLLEGALKRNPNQLPLWTIRSYVLTRAGRQEEAANSARRAIELDPDHFYAYFLLARTLKFRGQFEEAENAYRKAIELDPTKTGVIAEFGSMLADKGRGGEAEALFREALALDPSFSTAHNKLGLLYARQRRNAEAEHEFREAIRLAPKDDTLYSNLGVLLKNLGRMEEAERAYLTALQLNPNETRSNYNLGVLYLAQRRYAEAEERFRTAIGIDPNVAQPYASLGFILSARKLPKEAEVAFRKALELNPAMEYAAHNYALLLQSQGRVREAIAVYQKASESGSRAGDLHFFLGVALYNNGQAKEAEAAYRRALDLGFGAAGVYGNLGSILSESGRAQEAEPMLRKAVELEPRNAQWHDHLAHLLDRAGRLEEAVEAFCAAALANPADVHQLSEFAWSLVVLHRWDEAIATYRKCLELEPDGSITKNTLNNLAYALIRTDRRDEAGKLIERALKLRPDDFEASACRALLLAAEGQNLDEALNRAKKGAAQPNAHAWYWEVLGFVHFKRGEFDLAIEPLNRAARDYGKAYLAADALVTLGQVYEAKKNIPAAMDAYRRALVIEPSNKVAAEAIKRLVG